MVENEMGLDEYSGKVFSSEHEDQVEIITWAAANELAWPDLALLFAIPNGAKLPYRRGARGKRYSPEAIRLKAEGLRPGMPDLCLPVARGGWFGLFIELKHGVNRPTEKQSAMLDALTEQGYLAVVCWGHYEAKKFLQDYLSMPRTVAKGATER